MQHDDAALLFLTRRASLVSRQCSSDLVASRDLNIGWRNFPNWAGRSILFKTCKVYLPNTNLLMPMCLPDCPISRYIKVFALEVTIRTSVHPVWMQASDIRGPSALLASQRSSVCLAFINLLWACMYVIWLHVSYTRLANKALRCNVLTQMAALFEIVPAKDEDV